ncbi:MAG: M20/M25/M40 family metallo-hydrolase, partial [Elusimicrobia bacterium]|nr:M20/M25/M40 family metallo-hydrolase [Elusimicrobiota bacterium]
FSFISGEDKIQKVSEFYIPWEIEDTHPLVHAAVEAAEAAGCPSEAEYWKFYTNASYTGGHLGIPTIGFGPGEESECHTINESIALKDIEKAVEFFTLLPSFIRKYA